MKKKNLLGSRFLFLRVINFLKPSWNTYTKESSSSSWGLCVKLLFFFMGGHFGTSCCGFEQEEYFPPWKKNKLTDRAHPVGVCPGGVSRIKRKQTFFSLLLLLVHFFYISGSGGERSFLPRTLEGKKGFLLILPSSQTGHKVVREEEKREEKDGAAFLVNRHLPRHIQEEGFFLLWCHHFYLLLLLLVSTEIIEFPNH